MDRSEDTKLTEPLEILAELIRGHGHSVVEYEGWLAIDGKLPGMAMSFFRDPSWHASLEQVDFRILAAPGRIIYESFAIHGESERERLGMAFEKFTVGSLHVLLAALCGDAVSEQVTTELMRGPDGEPWTATLGPWQVTSFSGPASELQPLPELDALQPMMEARLTAHDVHWCRILYTNLLGKQGAEVLWDNEPWPEAEAMVRGLSWPSGDGTVRTFLVLTRGAPATAAPSSPAR